MAIDTQAKRCSAIASRRLPWFRRFAPIPDGSMTQGDRQQLSFVYRGILADAPVVVAGPVADIPASGRTALSIPASGRTAMSIPASGET